MTGFYKSISFEFTDVTMKIFVQDLNNWVKTATEVEKSEMKRIMLVMEVPAASITNVSSNVLTNFEQAFPKEYFKLGLEQDTKNVKEQD